MMGSMVQTPNELRRWLKLQHRKSWGARIPKIRKPDSDPAWAGKPAMGRAAYRARSRIRLNVQWDDTPIDMGAAILAAYEQLKAYSPPVSSRARAFDREAP